MTAVPLDCTLTLSQLYFLRLHDQVWEVRLLVVSVNLWSLIGDSCVVVLQVSLTPLARQHAMRCHFLAFRRHLYLLSVPTTNGRR